MAGYRQKLIDSLRRKREKIARRPNGVVSAFVLGSGSVGAPKCVYLHTDHDRYLFNCGEGSQRLAQELKLRLRRVQNIFITHPTWEKMAGLPGIAMALRDLGVLRVNIYAPKDISHVFSDASSFVRLQDLIVDCKICREDVYEDTDVRIIFAPITSTLGDHPGKAMCFVVLPKERRRVLDVARCTELGVPKGPLLGLLKSGQDVNIGSRIIKSAEVTSPAAQGITMLVVDVPSRNFIPSLVDSTVLAEHRNADYIIHFTSLEVMREPAYAQWMTEHSSACHLLVNDAAAFGTAGVSAAQQIFLNQLVPEAFPLLAVPSVLQSEDVGDRLQSSESRSGFGGTVPLPIGHESWRGSFPQSIENLVAARPLLEYRLMPPSRFNEFVYSPYPMKFKTEMHSHVLHCVV